MLSYGYDSIFFLNERGIVFLVCVLCLKKLKLSQSRPSSCLVFTWFCMACDDVKIIIYLRIITVSISIPTVSVIIHNKNTVYLHHQRRIKALCVSSLDFKKNWPSYNRNHYISFWLILNLRLLFSKSSFPRFLQLIWCKK